jgi:hypothetical protein
LKIKISKLRINRGGLRMKKFVLCLILVFGIFAIAGCEDDKPASDVKNVGMTSIRPLDYGNGVYYFPSSQANFGNALSAFIAANQDIELTSMASDDSSGYGHTTGYFVVFKVKK